MVHHRVSSVFIRDRKWLCHACELTHYGVAAAASGALWLHSMYRHLGNDDDRA